MGRSSSRAHRWRGQRCSLRSGRSCSRSSGAWIASRRVGQLYLYSILRPCVERIASSSRRSRGVIISRPLRAHPRASGHAGQPESRRSVETTLIAEFPKHAITRNQSLTPLSNRSILGLVVDLCFARPAHAYLNFSPGPISKRAYSTSLRWRLCSKGKFPRLSVQGNYVGGNTDPTSPPNDRCADAPVRTAAGAPPSAHADHRAA
jgi:hypothetical protein